jgi:hypothetical protein
MNVDIGTEAAQFPEKEYMNGIFLAVHNKLNPKYELLLWIAKQKHLIWF